jgi:hypothetical protein
VPNYPLSETAQAWWDYGFGPIEGKLVINVADTR